MSWETVLQAIAVVAIVVGLLVFIWKYDPNGGDKA